MTENLLKWSEFENSIFFCIAGAEVMLTLRMYCNLKDIVIHIVIKF